MKLSSEQARRVEEQIAGEAIPENHPLSPRLQTAFGDHTFFLNTDGLTIVEPTMTDRQIGEVVKLADWTDKSHTTLEPAAPEVMPAVIPLKA